jgi:hypothetical protein
MKATSWRRFGSAFVVAAMLALPATAAAQLAPVFDWSVPDRMGPDGMINLSMPLVESPETLRLLNPEKGLGGVEPAGWPADFTACASTGAIARYIWSVDGQPAADTSDCTARIRFPREGRYRVELTVVGTSGARVSTAQDVTIRDWLIVAVGDSYGSGEGVPHVAVTRDGLAAFEAAQAGWAQAEANYQQAFAAVAPAQAAVADAQRNLDAARRDLAALQAAWTEYLRAQNALVAAQAALNDANAAVVAAKAAVAAAQARVTFECAIPFNTTRCNAAKADLTRAKQAEAAAIATRDRAALTRDAAAADLARAAAALPAEGYDYMRGVLEARVALMVSRLDVAEAALRGALQFAADAHEIAGAALDVLREHARDAYAVWQDTIEVELGSARIPYRYSQCHQSKFSSQAQAALALERSDPKTSVTFVHLACSGATIPDGILGEYAGIEGERPGIGKRPAQLDMAARLTTGREIDGLVISIGGNDVGFGGIIKSCMLNEPCFVENGEDISDAQIDAVCEAADRRELPLGALRRQVCRTTLRQYADLVVGTNIEQEFFASLAALAGKYADVQARVQTLWPDLPADRVFLTEYPSLTRDQHDQVCGFEQDPQHNLPGVTSPENLWAEQVVGRQLNSAIVDQQALLGWTVVGGIEEAFRPHGYCSSETWIVNLRDSLVEQVSLTGTAHPTEAGQMATAARIAAALRGSFDPESNRADLGSARVDGRP